MGKTGRTEQRSGCRDGTGRGEAGSSWESSQGPSPVLGGLGLPLLTLGAHQVMPTCKA